MFKRFLLLLFAIPSSEACVPCDCAVPHTIVCRHLTEFPRFSERERRETTLLDITESSLKNIPEFTRVDWPALDLVTLWNNSNDLCKYSGWHDDILFENYDCSPSPPTIELCLAAEPQEHPNFVLGPAMLARMVPMSLFAILISIVRVLQTYQRRKRSLVDVINTANSGELRQLRDIQA